MSIQKLELKDSPTTEKELEKNNTTPGFFDLKIYQPKKQGLESRYVPLWREQKSREDYRKNYDPYFFSHTRELPTVAYESNQYLKNFEKNQELIQTIGMTFG